MTPFGVRHLVHGTGKPPKPGPAKQAPPSIRLFERQYSRRLLAVQAMFAHKVEEIARAALGGRADAKTPKDIPHEAIFGTASHRPEKVNVAAIEGIGGLTNAQYSRTGYRPESFEAVRAAPEELLPPVAVNVSHKGEVFLENGRHRLAVATERGRPTIKAHVRQRNARGDIVATRLVDVPTGAVPGVRVPALPAVPLRAARATGPLAEQLRAAYDAIVKAAGLEKWLGKFAGQMSDTTKAYVTKVTRLPPGSDGRARALEEFRQRNLRLIKGASEDQIQQIADVIRPAQATGARWETIAPDIADRLGVGQSRAKLIARDQTNKFNSAVMQVHQTSAGIEEYTWKTAGDMAVRGRPGGIYAKSKDKHWPLEGTRHRWGTPPLVPGTGEHMHPGEDIQCRCQAIPVIPFLEE